MLFVMMSGRCSPFRLAGSLKLNRYHNSACDSPDAEASPKGARWGSLAAGGHWRGGGGVELAAGRLAESSGGGSTAELRKRTLTNLYNQRPAWMENIHARLDAAVADAYGWWVDLANAEILERLLALNLERAGAPAEQ